jgi:hypothetical protein
MSPLRIMPEEDDQHALRESKPAFQQFYHGQLFYPIAVFRETATPAHASFPHTPARNQGADDAEECFPLRPHPTGMKISF